MTEQNIERTYRLTFVKNAYDNSIKEFSDYTWTDLIELFGEHRVTATKNEIGFITAKFKPVGEALPATNKGVPVTGTVGRVGANIASINCLVLDYDGGVTLDGVRSILSGLKHIGYTSYNHMKDGRTHKCRVIVPLKEECTAAQWAERRKALIALFPEADESGFSMAHIFYTPSTPGERETVTWHEDGEDFDLLSLSAEPLYVAPREQQVSDFDEEFKDEVLQQVSKCSFNTHEDWKALAGRLYNAGFSLSDFQNLSWASARKDCANLWKWFEGQGTPSGIRPLISRVRQEFPGWEPTEKAASLELVKKAPTEKVVEEVEIEERDVITMGDVNPQRNFKECTPSSDRKKRVKDFFNSFMSSNQALGVLRTAEGYGKSTILVEEALSQGHRVIFCSASNKQADEKMIDFAKHSAHRVWSRGGLIEKLYGVKPVYLDQATDDWGDPGLDVTATVAAICETGADFDEHDLQAIGERAAMSRETTSNLLVTTFSMADMMFRNSYGHVDAVVIVDDPSLGDMITAKYEQESYDQAPELVTERSSDDVFFGQEFWNQSKVLFTTTEHNVVTVIKKHHPKVLVKDMTQDLETGNNILLLSSSLVYKVTRKILPGIHKAVMEDTISEQEMIANGVKHQFNLVNTKGRNDLMKDTVIIISRPHPCDIAAVTHTLGLETIDRERVMQQMVVDQLNQALGRSQAYRGAAGNHVLVICDPKLELVLRNRCRYRLNTWDGLSRRGRLNGVPLVMHVHTPNWWSCWYSYLLTWQKWVVVVGGKVYETLSMQKLGLADDERKLIDRKLKTPPAFSEQVWAKRNEIVEDADSGRKNYTMELYELVDEFNKDKRSDHMAAVGKRNAGVKRKTGATGQKNFRSPDGKVKRFIPGTEPEGWTMTNKRAARK